MDFPGYHEQARQKGYRDYHHWWNGSAEAAAHKRLIRAKLKTGVCWCCGSYEHLQLHHVRYTILGEEPHTDFVLLCRDCHWACEQMTKTRVVAREEAHELRRFQIRRQAQAVKKRAA